MSHASKEQHDRRVNQRVSASIPCNFLCREGSHSGIAKDLSIDGAFVASDATPPNGSIGTLVFMSEGVVKLMVPSKVVRVVHSEESSQVEGFGLYFLHFGEDNLELLKAITSE